LTRTGGHGLDPSVMEYGQVAACCIKDIKHSCSI